MCNGLVMNSVLVSQSTEMNVPYFFFYLFTQKTSNKCQEFRFLPICGIRTQVSAVIPQVEVKLEVHSYLCLFAIQIKDPLVK